MGAKLKVLQIFSTIITLLLKIICKTLSNCPPEVSGCKCLKLGFSEFLALLYLLPLRKRCTLTIDFRNIGVKSWVLVLKTLGVKTLSHPSVCEKKYTDLSTPIWNFYAYKESTLGWTGLYMH